MAKIDALLSIADANTATQSTILQPTTGEPGHYKTKALGVGVIAAAVIVVVAVFTYRRLISQMRESVILRVVLSISAGAMAIVLSAIASWEDLFSPATYEFTATRTPDWHTLLWVGIWSAGSIATLAVSFIVLKFREDEGLESEKTKTELEKERAARVALERQRDLLTDITTFVMRIVKNKRDRLLRLIGKEITPELLHEAMNPTQQIVLLVKVIHEFFMPDHPPADFMLRLGIFVRDSQNRQQLSPVHCWDGQKEKCFQERLPEHLQIDNPHGLRSAVVRCFHSTDGCIIIPDCSKGDNYDALLLQKGHEKEAGSIAVYKHMYLNPLKEEDAMIVMLMASKADHFREQDKDEIKQFLDEILTRLELEWMISESLTKLSKTKAAGNGP